jgi:Uma2 family endonuclease
MSLPPPRYTVDEYLALEREAEERHEYLDGVIYAMAGESPEHGAICTNILGQLYQQLRGKPCQIFSKDMKVVSGPDPKNRRASKGLFSYPDLVVVCGALKFHDEYRDVLLNPTVIIEVLSPTTEAFDRGQKFWRYRTYLSSLVDYVLVSQSIPMIDHYVRRPDGEWVLSTVGDLGDSLSLGSIDCNLRFADVYDRVSFPQETPEQATEE